MPRHSPVGSECIYSTDILLIVISDLTSPVHVVIDFESDINMQRQVFPNGLIIGATTVVTTTGSLSVFLQGSSYKEHKKKAWIYLYI